MNTNCRIGKVTFKNGTELHPFRGTLREVRNQSSFPVLDRTNQLVEQGRVQAVAIAVIQDGGWIHHAYSKAPGISMAQMCAATVALQDFVLNDWNA